MSIAEKLITIAENTPKVYDKGVEHFEKLLTNNFERSDFTSIFAACDLKGHIFSKTLRPDLRIEKMFANYQGTELPQNIDCSNLECGNSSSYYRNVFYGAKKIIEIPDYKIPAIPYYLSTYYGCSSLQKISVVRCNRDTEFSNTFTGCSSLTTFQVEGKIGKSFNAMYSPLNPATLKSIISALVDYSGTSSDGVCSLTLSDISKAALESDETLSPNGNSWIEYVADLGWSLT